MIIVVFIKLPVLGTLCLISGALVGNGLNGGGGAGRENEGTGGMRCVTSWAHPELPVSSHVRPVSLLCT